MVDPWQALADEIARRQGAFARAEALLAETRLWRLRCAKAEGHLIALVRRRDLGGDVEDLLFDLVELVDEARGCLPREGAPPCSS